MFYRQNKSRRINESDYPRYDIDNAHIWYDSDELILDFEKILYSYHFYDDIDGLCWFKLCDNFEDDVIDIVEDIFKHLPQNILASIENLNPDIDLHYLFTPYSDRKGYLYKFTDADYGEIRIGFTKDFEIRDWELSEEIFREIARILSKSYRLNKLIEELPERAEECREYFGLPEFPEDDEFESMTLNETSKRRNKRCSRKVSERLASRRSR